MKKDQLYLTCGQVENEGRKGLVLPYLRPGGKEKGGGLRRNRSALHAARWKRKRGVGAS